MTIDVLERTRALVPLVEANADAGERDGTLAAPVVEAFRDQALFSLMVPRSLGGLEADIATVLTVFEEVSRADGSSGWSLLANVTSTAFAAVFCSDAAVAQMFGRGVVTHAGQFAPRGTSRAEGDGYRIAGAYSFGSGSGHADYIAGGTVELGPDGPRMLAEGRPVIRAFFVPRDQVDFTGNWDVMGLVGTGSYDYVVPDQHLDAGWTFDLIGAVPLRGGAVYRLGVLGMTASGHAAFALGVGRRALDELLVALDSRQRMGQARLAEQQKFQFDLGRHDAALRSARAYVYEAFGQAESRLSSGYDLTPVATQRLRQATTYATHVAADVVTFAYHAAGTAALRQPSVLGRCFRDIHASTQHVFVDDGTLVAYAQALVAEGAPTAVVPPSSRSAS